MVVVAQQSQHSHDPSRCLEKGRVIEKTEDSAEPDPKNPDKKIKIRVKYKLAVDLVCCVGQVTVRGTSWKGNRNTDDPGNLQRRFPVPCPTGMPHMEAPCECVIPVVVMSPAVVRIHGTCASPVLYSS